MIKFNLNNIVLLIAFVALPVAGLMLHSKLHSELTYLAWILWFDIVVITIFYLFERTRFYGFILNTVFFAVGVIMHLMYVEGGGITDILLSIPDFSIGFILWKLNNNVMQNNIMQKTEPSKVKASLNINSLKDNKNNIKTKK